MAIDTIEHIDSSDSHGRPEIIDHAYSAENATGLSGIETAQDDKRRTRWRLKHAHIMRPNARLEPRPYVHKYFFRRPRLRQYYQNGILVDSRGQRKGPVRLEDLTITHSSTGEGDGDTLGSNDSDTQLLERNSEDFSKAQKEWLNLFIDLLWTGIISNISDSFVANAFNPDSDWGLPFLQFVVLFMASFRLWDGVRRLLSGYFTKDFLQSLFLVWILLLAMFFGNQSPYFLDQLGGDIVIWTYLVARGTFVIMEAFYCFFIPEVRREFIVSTVIALPVIGLWAGALQLSWPKRANLMLPALFFEVAVSAIMSLPISDWLLRGAPRKALDPDNVVDRLQGFFIIVLGEGVYGLVTGRNWGVGFTPQVICAIFAMLIYYILFWLFFTGDQTKTYIHAIYRNHYTAQGFEACHNTIFAAVLILDASIGYLIDNSFDSSTDPQSLNLARWTISASLSAAIVGMTIRVLLNRSLDSPGTLAVNNRYIRMAPRGLACVVIMCLPMINPIATDTFIRVLFAVTMPLLSWEYFAALENPWRLIEPKDENNSGE